MENHRNRKSELTPAPLAQAVSQQLTGRSIGAPAEQKGFSLVEVMLGIAVATLVAGGTYGAYRHLDNKKQIRTEQAHVQDLARDVSAAYSSLGRYPTALRTAAIGDNLVPAQMVAGTQLRNAWGSAVDLVPTTIDGKTNAGLEIVYANVPKRACALFASAAGAGMFDVEINGDSVMSAGGGVDRLAVGEGCAPDAGSRVVFTYYSGATGLSVAAPASLCTSDPTNPLCVPEAAPPPSTPTTPPATTPPPPTPTITPPPPFTPPPVAPPPVAPPAPPPVPPTTPPAAPPPSAPPTFCPPVAAATAPKAARWCTHWVGDAGSVAWQDTACEDGTDGRDDRTFTCPTGQLIATAGPSQYDPSGPQRRALRETHHYECTDPWNADPGTFVDVWENDPSVAGNWSGWSPAYTGAPECVAPPATTQSQAGTPETRVVNCTAGQYGQLNQSRTTTQTRTVTYSCPTPISSPYTTTYGPWSAPGTPYGTWSTTSGSCTACPTLAPETQSQWVPASAACPSGQTGSHTWEKAQSRTRTRSYSCPAGTTALPPVSYGTWSTWADTGAKRNEVNTCAPTASCGTWEQGWVGSTPADEYNPYYVASWQVNGVSGGAGEWSECNEAFRGAGNCAGYDLWDAAETAAYNAAEAAITTGASCQSGDFLHVVDWSDCNKGLVGGPALCTMEEWEMVCNMAAPQACAPPPPPTTTCGNWTLVNQSIAPNWASQMGEYISFNDGAGQTCSAGWGWGLGTGTPYNQADYDAFKDCEDLQRAATNPRGPNAHWEYVEYSDWGGVATNSEDWAGPATCPTAPPPAPVCGPAPAPGSRTLSCPAGQYGSISQQHGWTSTAAPTCWTAQPWSTTSNTCTTCPTLAPETQSQWVAASAACPSGQTGSHTWEKAQSRSRTRSYSCPTGTTALPPVTYGTWSSWSDTGATRNVVNTCAPACTAASRTEHRWPSTGDLWGNYPSRACNSSTVGEVALAKIVSCGGSGCWGATRHYVCGSGGWTRYENGVGSPPGPWSTLLTQGDADWTTLTGGAPVTGNVKEWMTYECP